MPFVTLINIKKFLTKHAIVFGIGFLTGITIIVFKAFSLLVIYRYLRLDYYLCGVAIFFLAAGIFLHSKYGKQEMSVVPRDNLLDLLSNKEILVFQMLHEGKTNKEIAAALFIEVSTVKTHVNHIFSKISVSNRREARMKYSELTEKRPVL